MVRYVLIHSKANADFMCQLYNNRAVLVTSNNFITNIFFGDFWFQVDIRTMLVITCDTGIGKAKRKPRADWMVPNNNYKALFTKLDPFIFIVIINESPERTILILYIQQTYEILL